MAIVKDFTISKGGGRDHEAGYKRKLKINLREKSFATIFWLLDYASKFWL